MISNLRLASFACLLNSVCCGSILQSFRLQILAAFFHFFSLEMECIGKSNIVGTGFTFVGPRPPSKCLDIRVCLVTFRLSSRHAATSTSFLLTHSRRRKTMKSNTCNFGVFDWVLFLCLAVGTVDGTAVMFRYFLANSKKSLHKHCTFLTFPRISLTFTPKGHSSQDSREYEYCLLRKLILQACIFQITNSLQQQLTGVSHHQQLGE